MKKHSKVGNKPGKPAYRTPSTFIAKAAQKRAHDLHSRKPQSRHHPHPSPYSR